MKLILWIVTALVVVFVVGLCREFAKTRGSERLLRWTLGIGAVVIGFMWWAYLSWAGNPAREVEGAQRECDDATMAYVMSQNFVKQQLKSPGSAEFPYLNGTDVVSVPDHQCTFYVSAYVDSQNGFGAKIRAYYRATMTYDRSSAIWRAPELTIQQ
ncbi:hypothetical protein [Pseudomonas sp. NFACC04-2]|uniref:hypothetical protein n=1 Tax=Pseudomonas sp. NFACC04-2 TaxID=1566242 RepID=UPI0009085417|nr:hypothetical protein [Pseudomonas sp. NFACC04-2]SFW77338.1 hypothetical protein SAMN03159439_04636 [Pseudomonas sp. NFACC04-2]